jgi:Fe-S cluster assembly protein SufD
MATTEATPYLDAFREDGSEPEWLRDARQAALRAFAAHGFPTRREEAWRFTNLLPLTRSHFPPRRKPAPVADADTGIRRYGLEGETHRLVFIEGRYSERHSRIGTLPHGVWLASTARTIAERPDLVRQALDPSDTAGGQSFASLNGALFQDGFVLALDADARLPHPVEIHYLGHSEAAESRHLRNLILAGDRAAASVVETAAQGGPVWTNAVTQIALGDGAELGHIKIQDDAPEAIHIALARATLGDGAIYDSFTLTLGGELSRQDIQVKLGGGARCNINGAYLLAGEQDATHAVFIDHVAPGATTRELWKGVLDDRAHGAFLGAIAVRPAAQKTDARQTSRALLLSGRASVDTKPELEILADDVKCAHGAAVGDLDQDALFYLEARGIGLVEARRMLIEAFILEAVDQVGRLELRGHLAGEVRRRLGGETA